MTKRLGLSLSTLQALGILWLAIAMLLLPTERWTSLPISDALAADSQMGPSVPDWDSVYDPCILDIKSTERLYRPHGPIPEPGPFVIGCTLADCGPGTDGPGPIDLRITLTGNLAERALLEFENMTVRDAARIAVRGNARYVKGTTRFEVRSGTTVLRGFGTNAELRPPVAIPHMTLNRKALNAFKKAAKLDDLFATSKSSVTLVIEQFRQQVNVNKYAVDYGFRICRLPRPPTPRIPDRVEFSNGIPPDKVLVLAPGRVAQRLLGCADYEDEVYESSASATVPVKNHLEDEATLRVLRASVRHDATAPEILQRCHSEVVVYSCGSVDTTSNRCNSESSALAVVQPVDPRWTDPIGDIVPVVLSAPLPVNVAVWILDDPDGQAANDIHHEVTDTTRDSFHAAMCGIAFPAPTIKKIGSAEAPFPPGKNRSDYFLQEDPELALTEMQPDFYTQGSLNIYMVEGLSDYGVTLKATNPAESCEDLGQDPSTDSCDEFGDMIVINNNRLVDTVAHEIGHTLSLRHTDGGGFPATNLMYRGRTASNITKGQCYRANVDRTSFLNTDGGRPADWPTLPPRPALPPWPTLPLCPRGTAASTICPTLDFDTTP